MKFFIIFVIFTVHMFAADSVIESIDESKSKIETKNISNDTSKKSMQKWLNAEFGLQPYRTNYLLPFGITNKTYSVHGPSGVDYKNIEAEIQVSLKLKVVSNLFRLDEKYYLSYTHQAFWQIYTHSAPFRENLYNPEAFVIFPISDKKSVFQMRSLKLAIAHKSNGQPNTTDISVYKGFNLSKSINYLYATLRLQHQTLITDVTLMVPYLGPADLTDNPDIMKYMGYTKVKFIYFYNKNMFTFKVRGNIASLKGAVEATYSYPVYKSTYFYAKVFRGYME